MSVSRFLFLQVNFQLFWYYLFKRFSLLHCVALVIYVRDQLIIFMWVYFGALYSVSLICLFFHQYHTVLSVNVYV